MRVGLISDAHGFHSAFLRGLEVLNELGADVVLFLGDSVGYLPSCDVVEYLLRSDIKAIRGNHDEMVLSNEIDPVREYAYQHQLTRDRLTDEGFQFLLGLPDRFVGFGLTAFHGSPQNPVCGYVYPDSLIEADASLGGFVALGNTHRPFLREVDGQVFLNVGSCALPRDGGGLACLGLVDTSRRTAELVNYGIGDLVAEVIREFPMCEQVRTIFETCKSRTSGWAVIGVAHGSD